MNLNYTYEMDGDFFVGYLDDYPEYPTQGENLKDFEENLLDIYSMIKEGVLDARIRHGFLEIAVWTGTNKKGKHSAGIKYVFRHGLNVLLPVTRSRGYKKNDNCFVEQKNGAVVREYVGYDRLEGFQEQALLAAVYEPLVPLLNFFMPTQKLKSKTRIGSKEIKVYDNPESPFQRLSKSKEVSKEIKVSLSAQIALYNPVVLQHNANKAIIRLRQRLAQPNRITANG